MDDNYINLDDKIPEDEDKKKDGLIEALQSKLTALEEARNEERFGWLLVTVVLLNIFFFTDVGGWAVIATLFLELILLIMFTRKLGVSTLTEILDKYVLSHPCNPLNKKNKLIDSQVDLNESGKM